MDLTCKSVRTAYLLSVMLLLYRGLEFSIIKYADLAVIVSGILVAVLLQKLSIEHQTYFVVILFVGNMAVSLLLSPLPIVTANFLEFARVGLSMLMFMITYTIISHGVITPKEISRWLTIAAMPTATISVVTVLLVTIGATPPWSDVVLYFRGEVRAALLFYDPNYYANVLLLALGLSLIYLKDFGANFRERFAASLIPVLIVGAIISTGSRSGMGALLIMLTLLTLSYYYWLDKRIGFVLVGVGILSAVVIGTGVGNLSEIWNLIRPNSEIWRSIRIRKILWMGAIITWKLNPVFGVGPGNHIRFVENLPESAQPTIIDYPHNILLEVLADYGLVGLLLLVLLIGLVYTSARRAHNQRGPNTTLIILVCTLTGILAQGLFLDMYDARWLWFLFGLVVAHSDWLSKG